MTDTFFDYAGGLESPATHIRSVEPSDSKDLPQASRAINVATSGALRMTTVGGTTDTVHIAAGIAFPVRAIRIWKTGTTAAGIAVLS